MYAIPALFLIPYLIFLKSNLFDFLQETEKPRRQDIHYSNIPSSYFKISTGLMLLFVGTIFCFTNRETDIVFMNEMLNVNSIAEVAEIIKENSFYYKELDTGIMMKAILFVYMEMVKELKIGSVNFVPAVVIFIVLFMRLNFIMIEIPIFIMYLNSSPKYAVNHNRICIFMFMLEEVVLRNSYFYILILFASFFSFTVYDKQKINILSMKDWKMKKTYAENLFEATYLRVKIDGINNRDYQQALHFLYNNINHAYCEIVSDPFEIGYDIIVVFYKIDMNFGNRFSSSFIESEINSLIEKVNMKFLFSMDEKFPKKYQVVFERFNKF